MTVSSPEELDRFVVLYTDFEVNKYQTWNLSQLVHASFGILLRKLGQGVQMVHNRGRSREWIKMHTVADFIIVWCQKYKTLGASIKDLLSVANLEFHLARRGPDVAQRL